MEQTENWQAVTSPGSGKYDTDETVNRATKRRGDKVIELLFFRVRSVVLSSNAQLGAAYLAFRTKGERL